MDDMDKEAMEFGGEATFFTGEFEKYSWTKIFDPNSVALKCWLCMAKPL
jgi:hypothetical protein